jgi:hypothetical protein
MNSSILRLMPIRSGCAKLCRFRTVACRRRAAGNVLVILLATVGIFGVIAAAVFEGANAARDRALKNQYRDRATAGVEFGLEAIRQSIADQFRQQAYVDATSLSSDGGQTKGSKESGYYNIRIQARSADNQIFATQGHSALEGLTDPDDPFRGSVATVAKVSVAAQAESLVNSYKDRFGLPAMRFTPEIDVRQIPVSQFTLFASAASLALDPLRAASIGRVYSGGDLTIWGGQVSSLYPVIAGGNITLSDNGALLAQSDPDQPAVSFPVQSTTDNNWLACAKSTFRSTILSGRDLPIGMVEGTNVKGMTAQPSGGSGAIEQQQLGRQCALNVWENGGFINVVCASSGEVSPGERAAFSRRKKRNYPYGPVIVFDGSKAPAGQNTFYISSSNPNAIVLLRNARNLPDDFSVVSPLTIVVAGGFNDQGIRRAASLITSKRVVAVPENW